MSVRPILVTLLVVGLLIVTAPGAMARGGSTGWLGVQMLFPTGDAADRYDNGWALTGSTRWAVEPRVDMLLETAWIRLPSKSYRPEGSSQVIQAEDVSSLGVLFGVLYDMGSIEVGAKVGYYLFDLYDWDLVPTAQLTFGRFAVGGEYKALGTTNWGAAFLKYHW